MEIAHYLVSDRLGRLNGIGVGVQRITGYVHRGDAPHTHDVVELNYIVSGTAEHRIGDRVFASGPGGLGITHYTQVHDIDTHGDAAEVINLYLDLQRCELPDVGEELAGALHAILPLHPSLRHRRNQFVHLRFPDGEVEALLGAMLREQEAARPGWRESLRSHLRLLLIACARRALAEGAVAPSSGTDEIGESEARIERLRRELDADPAQPVQVAELARRLGWTTPHLCRAFKRHTGATILAYVQRQRLNAAMVRLRATRERVTDIALACGFNDPSFFARAFRAAVGMTPVAYRRSTAAGPAAA